MESFVFQKNYDFYVFEHNYSEINFNVNMFHWLEKDLKQHFELDFCNIDIFKRNDLDSIFTHHHQGYIKVINDKIKCYLFEYNIMRDKGFLCVKSDYKNFDFNVYESNYKKFIKSQKNKQLIREATFIFKTNCVFITQYFGVSKEYLKKSKKNELKLFINIFNKKIKHYETSK